MSAAPEEVPSVLLALEPYLKDIVLIGGWVPELYRRFGNLEWEGRLAQTIELDLLVESPLPADGRPSLREILESAGLRRARDELFPADWVDPAQDRTVVEFLMPNRGTAKGPSVRQVEEQGRLGAIVLPDAELLRDFTGVLAVPINGRVVQVRVPSLGVYALSKALSFGGRPVPAGALRFEDKRPKDLVYLHDTIMAGRAARARIKANLSAVAGSQKHIRAGQLATERLRPVVASDGGAQLDEAARKLAERDRLTNRAAQAQIQGAANELVEMLREVFGDPDGARS